MNLMKSTALVLTLAAAAVGVSCQQPSSQSAQPPAAPQVQENGRYQVIVSNEGGPGAVLFLLDTRDGGTWIYRPPTPPAFNGFWSDIPRLTYPPETWQQVFSTMVQQAQQAQQQAPPPGTATRPPTAEPAPSR